MTSTTTSAVKAGISSSSRGDYHMVARNSVVLLTRHLLLWGLNGLLVLFLPRYLGDEGLGRMQYALSLAGLFSVAVTLGAKQFMIKEIARDQNNISRYLGTAIVLRLIAAAAVMAIIYLIAQFYEEAREARLLVLVAGLWMVMTSFALLMSSILQGREEMTWTATAEVAAKIAVVGVGIPLLIYGFGPLAYVFVLLFGSSIQFFLNSLVVLRKYPVIWTVQPSVMKGLVTGGAPFLVLGILLNIYGQIDIVMLKIYTADAVVGWYAAANQIFSTVEWIPIALTTAMLPAMARMYVTNRVGLIKVARKGIIVGTMVVVPIAFGTSLLSVALFDVLPYPEGFKNSAPLLTVLALSIPITTLLVIIGTIVAAADRQRVWSIALLFTVAAKVAMNVVAIPYFMRSFDNGGIGAALTTLISESLMILISLRLVPKGVFDWSTLMTLGKVLLAGVVMLVAGWFAREAGVGLPAVIAICAAIYVAAILLSKAVSRNDVAYMWRIATSRLAARRPEKEVDA